MNKEQIDEIALRLAGGVLADSSVGRTTIDFTHALLAELAKVQEPVAMYCGYNPSMGHVFRADAVIEVGTYLYTQPLPQPDLVAEIERLKALSVNNIMLDVVPGDGSGQEVYAKSVDEVVKALTQLSEKAEDLFSTERRLESYIKEAEKLRQQLSEAQSRIELLEHDAKTGDYETLYAQTVVELSAAQASESELLKALEEVEAKYFALLKDEDAEAEGFKAEGDMYGWNFHTGVHTGAVQMHLYMTNLLKLAATHKERKEGK